MTLDEAIKHCEEVAKARETEADKITDAKELLDCLECSCEHQQLAEWLKDYKSFLIRMARSQGKWIESGVDISGHRLNRCSICNGVYQMSYVGDSLIRWHFCPNCGVSMRKGET